MSIKTTGGYLVYTDGGDVKFLTEPEFIELKTNRFDNGFETIREL